MSGDRASHPGEHDHATPRDQELPDQELEQFTLHGIAPQGGPISPLIANLFLHYGLDMWLLREFPTVRFERFADDAVVHCVTERQAHQVWAALADRLESVGLRLHPDKTKIVYCKDRRRRGSHE